MDKQREMSREILVALGWKPQPRYTDAPYRDVDWHLPTCEIFDKVVFFGDCLLCPGSNRDLDRNLSDPGVFWPMFLDWCGKGYNYSHHYIPVRERPFSFSIARSQSTFTIGFCEADTLAEAGISAWHAALVALGWKVLQPPPSVKRQ